MEKEFTKLFLAEPIEDPKGINPQTEKNKEDDWDDQPQDLISFI